MIPVRRLQPFSAEMLPINRLAEPLDALIGRLSSDWRPWVDRWRASPEGRHGVQFVDERVRAGALIYPGAVFRALEATPLSSTRVVILGQDPYHGPGQAEGLAFSVGAGVRCPPSLRNIFKEAARDLGWPALPGCGHLGPWAAQGVLLLNTCLTVEDGRPGSHAGIGWEALTDAVVQAAAADAQPKVFLLWGAHAQSKSRFVPTGLAARHRVMACNHPSPLSASRGPTPFIGCGHFRAAAEFLSTQEAGRPIDWSLA